MEPTEVAVDRKRFLLQVRVIWFALVMGVAVIAGVFTVLIANGSRPRDANDGAVTLMFYVCIGLAAMNIPLGLFLRGQVMKRGWVGDVVKPLAYQTGNIVAWAMFEGVAFFSLIICLLAGTFWPYILPGAAAWLVMLLTWPNGRAMFPPATLTR